MRDAIAGAADDQLVTTVASRQSQRTALQAGNVACAFTQQLASPRCVAMQQAEYLRRILAFSAPYLAGREAAATSSANWVFLN